MVVTWKSPVSIRTSTALTTGGLKSRFLYFGSHGALSSKYAAFCASFIIAVVTGLSVIVTKLCELPLAPRAIAIDLDEAVGEIDGGVVPHPVGAELQPVISDRRSGRSESDRRSPSPAPDRRPRAPSRDTRSPSSDRSHRDRVGPSRPACRRDRSPRGCRRASFTTREFSGYCLLERLQVGERDALVERVGARLEDVLARRRRLRGRHRLERRIEDRLVEVGQLLLHRVGGRRAAAGRAYGDVNAPAACALSAASCSSSNVNVGHELLRRSARCGCRDWPRRAARTRGSSRTSPAARPRDATRSLRAAVSGAARSATAGRR